MNLSTTSRQLQYWLIHQTQALYTAFLQAPRADRELLYAMMRESLQSNIPLASVFGELSKDTSNKRIMQLARSALRGISETDDYTHFLHETGFFPHAELRLLKVAARNDSTPIVCEYLLETLQKESTTFNRRCIKTAGGNLISYPITVIGCIYASDYLSGMRTIPGQSQPFFFTLTDFAQNNIFLLLILPLLLILGHQYLKSRVYQFRSLAHRFGIFQLYDMEQEIALCRLCSALLPGNPNTTELVDFLIGSFRHNSQLIRRLRNANKRAAETELIELLPLFISIPSVAKIRSKSPLGTPEQIASGCLFASQILTLQHQSRCTSATTLTQYVALAATFLFIIPLTILVAGI